MAKTVREKVTDRIMEMLKRAKYRRNSAQLHIVVHCARLKIVSTSDLFPGDTYVLKVTNQHGNAQSRQTVTVDVNILDRHIALTPLLRKPERR